MKNLFSFTMIAFVIACGTSTTTSSGGASLAVGSADTLPRVAGHAPSAGTSFLELSITLSNAGSSTALPANAVLFGLTTSQSLVITPSPLSSALAPACAANTSVASGGSYTCDLLFEVPVGQTGTELAYDDQLGHKATSAVPAVTPPTACEQVYDWFSNGQATGTCLTCLETQCQTENQAEVAACGANTTCTCSDAGGGTPKDACVCAQTCQTSACAQATQTWQTCVVTACTASCN